MHQPLGHKGQTKKEKGLFPVGLDAFVKRFLIILVPKYSFANQNIV